MKIALIDVETTGLDPDKNHELIEIGMVVFDAETCIIESELDIKVKPDFPWLGDDKALAMNGFNEDAWTNAMSKERAIDLLQQKSEGAAFAAWNATFDWTFLRATMRETKRLDTFSHRRLCVMSMAFQHLPFGIVKPFSLENVCKYLGIIPEPMPHRAINGARAAYEVYKKIQGK